MREEGPVGYLGDKTKNKIRPVFKDGEDGDLVLVYNSLRETDHSTSTKFQERWMGPFRVKEKLSSGSYRLEDMNGAVHSGTFAPRRLRIFHQDTDGWWVERPRDGPPEEELDEDGGLSSHGVATPPQTKVYIPVSRGTPPDHRDTGEAIDLFSVELSRRALRQRECDERSLGVCRLFARSGD